MLTLLTFNKSLLKRSFAKIPTIAAVSLEMILCLVFMKVSKVGNLCNDFIAKTLSRLVKFCSDKKIDLVGESNDYYWATLSESEKIEKMNERLDLITDKLTEIAEKDMKGGKKVLAFVRTKFY